ncbi:hypothetical protein ANN_11931 [Periplaneta americana]|uniref:Reverse transcriptase domain-containing protein n=1 Tax=Periplaneta americana TaxID=6978 RepID=A0ABQ8T8P1_PERAM|nr:hypothetical protein ANN_11931 [Periplaneta americana]
MGGVIAGGKFADDTALLAEEKTVLTDMLVELNDSCEQYEMKNTNKTKTIVIARKTKKVNLRLRWAGHVARMGESRNAYRVLFGRPEGNRPLGRPRRRWEDNIKMDLREVGYDDRDWINLAQDRDRWRAYVRAAMRFLKSHLYPSTLSAIAKITCWQKASLNGLAIPTDPNYTDFPYFVRPLLGLPNTNNPTTKRYRTPGVIIVVVSNPTSSNRSSISSNPTSSNRSSISSNPTSSNRSSISSNPTSSNRSSISSNPTSSNRSSISSNLISSNRNSISSNIISSNRSSISSNLISSNPSSISSNPTSSNRSSISSNLISSNRVSISSNLISSNRSNISNNLISSNHSSISSNPTSSNRSSISSNPTSSNRSSISSNPISSNRSSISSNLISSNRSSISSNLISSNRSSISSNPTSSNRSSISSNPTSSNRSNISSNLISSNRSNISNNLISSNHSSISSNLISSNRSSISSNPISSNRSSISSNPTSSNRSNINDSIMAPKTAAEKMRDYRKRMSEEKKAEVRKKNREQQKKCRKQWKDQRRALERKNAKERMRKMRKRKALKQDIRPVQSPLQFFGSVQALAKLFTGDTISRQLPGRKDFVTEKDHESGKKRMTQKKILIMTVMEAYKLFKQENVGIKLGKSKFAALRPQHVRPVSDKDLNWNSTNHKELIETTLFEAKEELLSQLPNLLRHCFTANIQLREIRHLKQTCCKNEAVLQEDFAENFAIRDNDGEVSPGSSTENYPAFAHIGLRENPGKNLNQVTCPDRDSNLVHLVSQPDALTVTPQSLMLAGNEFQSLGRAIVKEYGYEEVRWDGIVSIVSWRERVFRLWWEERKELRQPSYYRGASRSRWGNRDATWANGQYLCENMIQY